MTTTFKQYVGEDLYTLTVPKVRVDFLINRVDRMNELGLTVKATNLVAQYVIEKNGVAVDNTKLVVQETLVTTDKTKSKKGSKREMILALIAEQKALNATRGELILKVQNVFEITYANARHYVVTVAGI